MCQIIELICQSWKVWMKDDFPIVLKSAGNLASIYSSWVCSQLWVSAMQSLKSPPPLHPFLIFSTSFLASTGVVLHRKIPYYMGSTHLGSNPTYFRYNQCQRKPSTNRSTLIFAAAAIYGEYTFPSHILYLIFRAVWVNPSVAINKRSQWKLSRVYFLKVARIDIYIWGQKNVQVYGIYCK